MSLLYTLVQRGKRNFLDDLLLNRLIKNSTWLFSGNIVTMVLGLIQGILVARALGVEQLGVLGIITSFTGVMGQVFDSRSWETSVKYVTHFWNKGDKLSALAIIKFGYYTDIATSIFSFFLAWSLSNWFARTFLGNEEYCQIVQIYAIVLLLGWNGGVQAIARVFNRFDLLAKTQVGINLFRFVAIVLVIYFLEMGLVGLVMTYVVTAGLSLVIGLILLWYFIRTYFKISWHRAGLQNLNGHWNDIIRFFASTNLTEILKIVQRNGPILALGYWSTPTQVGYYKLADSFAQRLNLIYNPVFQSIYPELSALWAKKLSNDILALVRKIMLLLAVVGLATTIGALLLGNPFIRFAVGDEFIPASVVLIILTFVYAVAGTLIWCGPLILASGRAIHQSIAVAIGSIVMLISLVLLIPILGAVGAALGFLAFYFGWGTVAMISIFYSYRKLLTEESNNVR